jgi:hypothetical protein
MSLHAVDDLEEAFEATKAFLLPFQWGRWLRLAIVAFFVAGASGSFPTTGTNFSFDGGTVDGGDVTFPADLGPVTIADSGELLALVLAVVGVIVALALLLGFVGSVMEFVLIRSLREEEVHVRRYFGDHWGAGLRLFGFRLGIGLLAFALVVGPVLALLFATGGPAAIDGPGAVFGLVLLAVPLALVFGTLFVLIDGFTTFFVVPVMLVENRAVLSAWRRFWGVLRAEWKEYLVFVVLTAVLTLVAGTAVGFVVGIVGLVLVGPVVVAGIAGAITGSPVVLAVVAVIGAGAVLAVLFVAAFVRVPVVTYFRYYALLVLGDTESDLDAIPERRGRIRAAEAGSDGDRGASDDASGAESA